MSKKHAKQQGQFFTDSKAVCYMLDEVGYAHDKNLQNIKILEPAAGDGAFALEVIQRLYKSSKKFNFSFENSLKNCVLFVEKDVLIFEQLVEKIDYLLEKLIGKQALENISSLICINDNFLKHNFTKQYDIVIGNPPYVRHELITEEDKVLYKKVFQAFRYRADLYILFFECSLNLLKPNGTLSFICSNRWLKNQYGKSLRGFIATHYNLTKLLNLENARVFEKNVTAYPCICIIKNETAQATTLFCEFDSKNIDFCNLHFERIKHPQNSDWQTLFLSCNTDNKALATITEQGFEIGIGVATGADKIFIKNKSELGKIEPNMVLPIISSKDLRNNKMKWGENYLINPYENGTICNLENYPNLKKYFYGNKEILSQRYTAQKTPNMWYRTIDKVDINLKNKTKILLPDITSNTYIFIDEGKFYPHHSLYYIVGGNFASLKIVASFLMSGFVRRQLLQIGIRMNGGIPRFQAQTLKKIKIPTLSLLEQKEKNTLIDAFERKNIEIINKIVDGFCLKHGIAAL